MPILFRPLHSEVCDQITKGRCIEDLQRTWHNVCKPGNEFNGPLALLHSFLSVENEIGQMQQSIVGTLRLLVHRNWKLMHLEATRVMILLTDKG